MYKTGYGLDDTNDTFPGIIQIKIDWLGLNYEVVNSGEAAKFPLVAEVESIGY